MQLRIEVMSERVRQEIDVRRLQGYDVEDCFATWEQVKDHRDGPERT